MDTELKELVGKKVKKIFLNNYNLRFETDNGNFTYEVTGDCCSHSFFYDFFGVKNLLGHIVKEVKTVELHPTDLFVVPDRGDSTSVYGFSITVEPNEEDWEGEKTAVFSL